MSKVNQLKNKARREEQRENWSRAIELYTQALDASRMQGEGFADLSLYNRIGDIYLRIGQKNTAVRYYEQAIERYAEQDLHTSAIALCNKVLRIHPERSTIFLQLGRLNLATNLIADARAHFHRYAEAMRERGTEDAAFEALEELIEETGDQQTLQLWISWLAAMPDEGAAIARVEGQRNSLIAHGIGPDQVVEQVRTGETGDIARDPVSSKQSDPLADAFLSMPELAPAPSEDPSPASDRDASEDSPADLPHPILADDLPYPVGATDLPAPEVPAPLPLLEPAAESEIAGPADTESGFGERELVESLAAEWESDVFADSWTGAESREGSDSPDCDEPEVAELEVAESGAVEWSPSPSAASDAPVPEPAPLQLGSMQWDDEAEELLAELNRPLEAAWSEYEIETHDPAPPLRSAPEPETAPEREECPAAESFVPAEPDGSETFDSAWSDRDDDWTPAIEAIDLDADLFVDEAVAEARDDLLEAEEADAGLPVQASSEPEVALSEDLEEWEGLVPAAIELSPTFQGAEADEGPESESAPRIDDLPSFEEEPSVLEEEVPEPEAAEPAEEDWAAELEPVFDVGTIEEPEESEDFGLTGGQEGANGAGDTPDVISSIVAAPEDAEVPEIEDDAWAAAALDTIEAIRAPELEAEPEPVMGAEPESVMEAEPEPVMEAEPESVMEAEPDPVMEADPEPEPPAPYRPIIEPPTIASLDPEIRVEPAPAPDPIGEVELVSIDEAAADPSEEDRASLIDALEAETLTVETPPPAPVPADAEPPVSTAVEAEDPDDEMSGSFAESRLTIEEDPEDAFRDWVQSASVGVLKRALPELENRSESEKALLVIQRLSQLEDTDVEFRTRLIDHLEKLGRVELAADACLTLGTTLQLMGRTAEAGKAYSRALRIRPGHEAARVALEQLGDGAETEGMEEAIPVVPTPYSPEHVTSHDTHAILETEIRSPIMPQNGNGDEELRPYSGVAGGAEASADFEQLLSEFRAELHQKPGASGSSSHTELGASLKEMGRLDDAIRELQAAVREPSAPPLAYELLGEAFMEKGQGRIAIRLLEKAIGTLGHGDRELMGVLYQLGRAYESTTEPARALVCYERIFSVDIDYRDIQDRILTCSA